MSRTKKSIPIRKTKDKLEEWPVWYHPDAPLGSAVRYIASLSPRFDWVGIYELRGKVLHLGPFMGEETEHTKIPIGKGVCGTAVDQGTNQNIHDVKQIENYLCCNPFVRSELVVLIRNPAGKIVGEIDIDSRTPNAFGNTEEAQIQKVADELGALWPA